MADNRLDLHTKLVELLGSEYVYFQPPATIKMKYPCIVYKRDDQAETFADNFLYFGMKRYSITIIDANPDSLIPNKMMGFRYCTFNTHFTTDGLNHDMYTLYF